MTEIPKTKTSYPQPFTDEELERIRRHPLNSTEARLVAMIDNLRQDMLDN